MTAEQFRYEKLKREEFLREGVRNFPFLDGREVAKADTEGSLGSQKRGIIHQTGGTFRDKAVLKDDTKILDDLDEFPQLISKDERRLGLPDTTPLNPADDAGLNW